jgi:acyl dehydratase
MSLKTNAVGKTYEAVEFDVDAERIAKYADAVGEEGAIHRDADAAREAGFRDVVAPPMFCVTYAGAALGPALFDPEVDMNFATMVHGGQEYEWGEPVCAGDRISTVAKVVDIAEKDGKGFYVFETVSTNQDGAETVRGRCTCIVRGV